MSDRGKSTHFEHVPLAVVKETAGRAYKAKRSKLRLVRDPVKPKTEPYSIPPERLDRNEP